MKLSYVRRWILRVAAGIAASIFIGGLLWLAVLGQPPPVPSLTSDAGRVPQPDYAVTFVPGIGPKTVGECTRILSIDGGGVRGLVPAILLAEIERQTGKPIYEQFHLIVGASTGAILSLGLTRPSNSDARKAAYSANDLADLYRKNAARIFPQSWRPIRYLRRIFRPAYDPTSVESVFSSYFEDVQLQEALTNIAVPGYDIEDGRRLWFASYSASAGDVLMKDLVRGATAAPTYLPPARFAVQRHVSGKGYVALVDGALFANNPAPDALTFARKVRAGGDQSVLLLSIGTGKTGRHHTFAQAWGWGVLGWMDPLLDIAFSDPAIDDQIARTLEGRSNYFRLQADLGPAPIDIDNASPETMRHLEEAATTYIKANADAFASIAANLALPRSPQCGPPMGADYERPDGPRHGQSNRN